MWADSLLALERGHLLRLAVWGAACLLVGTALLALLARRAAPAPLVRHFAIQTAAWGAIDLAICAWGWQGLALRDFGGAVRLTQFLWLNVGLDLGYALVGITLAVAGWKVAPRPGLVGAGLGVVLQGVVLAVLDLVLLDRIGPLG